MRLALAPMEGVVDHHFRRLYSEIGGLDFCVTEFLRVNDLPASRKQLRAICPELSHHSKTVSGLPVRLQLLGSNPDTLAETALLAVEQGAAAIDLNFGCPAKTVNKSRGGAVLLDEPELVATIVAAVRAAVPEAISVSAKIRLGFRDRERYLDNALAIAEAGANELCVHARSRADGYKPPAYWHYLAAIREALAIPVIANGEIWSVADWRNCQRQSQCADFMMGRGLIARPDLALQIRAADAGEAFTPWRWPQLLPLLYRFYHDNQAAYPQRFLGNRLKQWLFYLQRNYVEAGVFFETIKRHRQPQQFEAAFACQFKSEGMGMGDGECAISEAALLSSA